MASDQPKDLAGVLGSLRRQAELSRRQLETVSGVSEETVKAIEYRRNVRPTPDTLRKLATGLATNRALGRVDLGAADEMLEALMRAAHYLPAAPEVPDDRTEPAPTDGMADLRAALLARGFRPDEASTVDEILADLATRPDSYRSQLLDIVGALVLKLHDAGRNE